jgi:lipid-binding SYLF domain-containing protein
VRTQLLLLMVLMGAASVSAAPTSDQVKRMNDSARVLRELRASPDSGIPANLWDRARCVAVLPGVKKAAIVFGGEFGKGVVSCREGGSWSTPAFLTLEKGSWGAQLGAESTDVVLLVMNEQGMNRLLQDKVTLGADASITAGPVGRSGTAATDAQLTTEMLSYSRSHGLFAGIDLSGGVLRPDDHADAAFYGRTLSARQILGDHSHLTTPDAARTFIASLRANVQYGTQRHGA